MSWRLRYPGADYSGPCAEFADQQWADVAPFENDRNRGLEAERICRRLRGCDSHYQTGDFIRLGVACEADGRVGACVRSEFIVYYYSSPEVARLDRFACEDHGGVWRSLLRPRRR